MALPDKALEEEEAIRLTGGGGQVNCIDDTEMQLVEEEVWANGASRVERVWSR
jgi:hypothetical protein